MSNTIELKDFQKATSNRIFKVFMKGQNRVLLADEVGLGKTIIARDVISKISNHYKEQENRKKFKVIYICSNINIANQNAKKLGISNIKNVSESRLSMQHLKIFQAQNEDEYEQLIPITPATSFSMTSGCGTQEERALMYAHLKRQEVLKKYIEKLKIMMAYTAEKNWEWYVNEYERQVQECNSNGCKYVEKIADELKKKFGEDSDFKQRFLQVLSLSEDEMKKESRNIIKKLRKIFAEISIDMFKPDLVIMDEFQRFRELIDTENKKDEYGMITQKFLHNKDMKVLLLSATPYKPYSTLKEIEDDSSNEHYGEFMELMKFLFYKENAAKNFKIVWQNYSNALKECGNNEMTILISKKNKAEEALYKGICRTERANTGIIDDSGVMKVKISEGDILSFSAMQSVVDEISKNLKILRKNIPIDYIKSSPYLLSFMEHYKLKLQISDYVKNNKLVSINEVTSKYLFISKNKIENYNEIPSNNARLDKLKDITFKSGIENLLWIPPSKFYYKTNSIFDKNKTASKILLFSSWEMVPRMVSVLLSYEAERLTIGKLQSRKNKGYFQKENESRYGISRLRDDTEDVICYPCKYLAKLYSPNEYMGKDIGEIRNELSNIIKDNLAELREKLKIDNSGKVTAKVIIETMKILDKTGDYNINSIPINIDKVLVDIAIAGPAICGLRIFDYNEALAKDFVKKIFVSMFNKPESSAIIDLLYGEKDESFYYENVFKYCVDGNLQAVLDEYSHMLNEENKKNLASEMENSYIETASLQIETKESFENSNSKKIHLRTHFAVGYFNTRITDKSMQRTENIRKSFNSPFRPFVLATTSIGQEGLDFHNYSRKIVHWNLPSNPIDLEQREGRINRFKCLAVRRNIAAKYGDKNTWNEMFNEARENDKGNNSDLVPFWQLPSKEKCTNEKIERIVLMYPFSSDINKYKRLIEVLSRYRLTLGQPRQEELIDVFKENFNEDDTNKLFINLSPFDKVLKIRQFNKRKKYQKKKY